MGRWRPPAPKSSAYITPAGYAALDEEQKALWLKRREVVAALSAAAAEGDRSENAEYIYRKKELGGLDRRIRYLQKRLPDLTVVRDQPSADRVFFGAWVELLDDNDAKKRYRIVGPDETNGARGWISMDSPLAKALLRKNLGDEVQIDLAGEKRAFEIVSICYTVADDHSQD